MKTLYFMRHAQSEANLQDILASRQDYELTEKGRLDAAAIAAELRERVELDQVVSSPLLRAQQTADPIIHAYGLGLTLEPRLIEQELGVFSGMTYVELADRTDYMHDRAARWDWVPAGGGESYEMIAKRLFSFFEELDPQSGEQILFVTHAVTMRLIKAILEQTLPAYPLEIAKNGEIWKVAFRGVDEPHTVESIFLGGSAAAISRA